MAEILAKRVNHYLINAGNPEILIKITQTLSDLESRRIKWTMTHSFCAIMGGFAIDTNDGTGKPYISGSPQFILSVDGILLLAEHEERAFTDVTENTIMSRSKTDGLAKILVCLQTSWMIISCIGRAASHLPLTLLEINTLGHVFCAIMLYILWFNKPQDIDEPIVLTGEWVRPWGAVISMCNASKGESGIEQEISQLNYYTKGGGSLCLNQSHIQHRTTTARQILSIKRSPLHPNPIHNREGQLTGTSESQQSSDNESNPFGAANFTTMTGNLSLSTKVQQDDYHIEDDLLPCVHKHYYYSHKHCRGSLIHDKISLPMCPDGSVFVLERESLGAEGFGPKILPAQQLGRSSKRPRAIRIDTISIKRLQLASQCLSIHPDILEWHKKWSCSGDAWDLHCRTTLLVAEAPDWIKEGFAYTKKLQLQLILCLASGVFGGVHALAWNSFFISTPELWLWRISSIIITCSGVVAAICVAINLAVKRLFAVSSENVVYSLSSLFPLLLSAFLTTMPLAYCAARIYLLVEAFVSLRSLPAEAYQTPDWTQLIPHF
ncbi:hypothetical protein MMC20_000528 [Loxospora ochrophaea]|nr:hypothetical protein [Loxospora ochrophaea]